MALPSPPPYSQPIPNNPFYSPEEAEVCTPSGTYVVGCGLGVCYDTGTLVALGDGTGTVQLINTGTGLTGGPITVNGTLALEPLAVPPTGTYAYPSSVDVDPYGRVTSVTAAALPVYASAFNTLGAVLAGTGAPEGYSALAPGALNQVLTADPAAPLGVKWEYTIPDGVTEVTGTLPIVISNPTGPSTDVSIASASLVACGAVQLTDSLTDTSTALALTASAGKNLQDQVNLKVPASAFAAGGDLLVGTGAGTYVALTAGAANTVLSSDGLGNLVWVADSAGDVTGVTGTAPITVDNTDPQNPIVTVDAASTTASGVVQLNDTVVSTSTAEAATANAVKTAYDAAAAAQATADAAVTGVTGTAPITVDNTDPKNPIVTVAAASTTAPGVVQLNDTVVSTSTTEAATANAVKTAYDLANAAVPDSSFTIKGDLLVGSGAGTYGNLVPGADGQFLVADSVSIPGLKYTASLPQVTAPTASTDAGNEGEVASDATYFYFYTGGRWQRIAWDATVW